ncbi:MAG: DSD1 family PLP-dependent enzyme [Anaerolineaceae bacterium]|nr:DSD1 family PLP-dependent enzyme [Anaerolineaceae bacterium]
MDGHEYEVGLPKNELDTPALLLDMNTVERNIQKMADYAKNAGINLRPHAKIYKATPVFAWLQIQAGAIGITVSKLSEAEILATAGIKDILIANQVVGSRKIQRLINLAGYTHVKEAVDSAENIQDLSSAAQLKGIKLGVVIEVNIGNNRCGVEPFEPTLKLALMIQSLQGLEFKGLMGYDGHLVFLKDLVERDKRSREAYQILVDTSRYLENKGIDVEIVSGGGSCTYQSASCVKGVTELQVGTYIFMDTQFRDNGGLEEFECALSILATIISRPERAGAENLAILDIGRKAIDNTYGFPEVKFPSGTIFSMPQEHSRLKFNSSDSRLKVGDKVELWVRDANGTVNLYDKIYAIRNERVEAVWDLIGRGKVT